MRKKGRPPRRRVPLEESIVVGTWRAYPFDDKNWAVEPIFRFSEDGEPTPYSERSLERLRTFHRSLEDALMKILAKRIGDGARLIVQDWLLRIQEAKNDIRGAILEYSESLRLKGLRLTDDVPNPDESDERAGA